MSGGPDRLARAAVRPDDAVAAQLAPAQVLGGETSRETPGPPDERAAEETSAEAGAEAASIEQARPEAVGLVSSGGPPPAPGGGPGAHEGTVAEEEPAWRARRHRGMPRLRIGWHVATHTELDRLQVAGTSFGFRLGRDQARLPVAVPLFRPEPVSVAMISGLWATRLLVSRALGFGARVVIFSQNPADWRGLGTTRVAVLEPGGSAGFVASPDAPVLCVSTAVEDAAGGASIEPGAWTTRLVVLDEDASARSEIVSAADLLLVQRLAPGAAAVVAQERGVPADHARSLRLLHDDMLAVLRRSSAEYVWLDPTDDEEAKFGPPTRV